MSRAMDDLMHGHEAFLFALGILHDIDQCLTAGQSTSAEDAAAFIGFL